MRFEKLREAIRLRYVPLHGGTARVRRRFLRMPRYGRDAMAPAQQLFQNLAADFPRGAYVSDFHGVTLSERNFQDEYSFVMTPFGQVMWGSFRYLLRRRHRAWLYVYNAAKGGGLGGR